MPLSKCNKATGKCEMCPKGTSSPGCVPDAACENTCSQGPTTKKYKCDWDTTPKCVEDPNG